MSHQSQPGLVVTRFNALVKRIRTLREDIQALQSKDWDVKSRGGNLDVSEPTMQQVIGRANSLSQSVYPQEVFDLICGEDDHEDLLPTGPVRFARSGYLVTYLGRSSICAVECTTDSRRQVALEYLRAAVQQTLCDLQAKLAQAKASLGDLRFQVASGQLLIE